jgi:hypothetical protein
MNLWKCSFSDIKEQGVYAFVETLMPHAIHIRQALEEGATPGSTVLTM